MTVSPATFDITIPATGAPAFRNFKLNDYNPLTGHYKVRCLSAPNESMKQIHAQLIPQLRKLQAANGGSPYATACLPGSSPLKNVQRHRANRFVFLLDISSFYQSIDRSRLLEMLSARLTERDGRLFMSEVELLWLQSFLDAYFLTPQGCLPTGAPASPDLANMYATHWIDTELEELLNHYGLTYSRYLDDLTFSSREPITPGVRRQIREVLDGAGFKVSHSKARVHDLKRNGCLNINGIGLAHGGRLFVPRPYLRKIRGLLHLATTRGTIRQEVMAGYLGVFYGVTPRQVRLQDATEQDMTRRIEAYKRTLPRKSPLRLIA